MRVRLFYEVIIDKEDRLDIDYLSLGIEEMIKDIDGVESVMITVEEELK